MLAIAGCIGIFAIRAAAEGWDYYWDHPCFEDPESTLICPYTQQLTIGFGPGTECWCVGEWSNPDHWNGEAGYPDEPGETALIWHSNTGHCVGGSQDGEPCSDHDDCPGVSNGCIKLESYLAIGITTEAFEGFNIRSKDMPNASHDTLTVRFDSERCVGGPNGGKWCDTSLDCPSGTCYTYTETMTTGIVGIHAASGPATLELSDSVRLYPAGLNLDAENGEVTVVITDSATLKTDTSD